MIFGLHGVVPAVHHAISEGWFNAITQASLGWVILMGFLYILGALIYMLRVPERFFPGKCDIWVRSGEKIDNFRFFFFFRCVSNSLSFFRFFSPPQTVSKPSNISRVCISRCLRTQSRIIGNGELQSHGGRLHKTRSFGHSFLNFFFFYHRHYYYYYHYHHYYYFFLFLTKEQSTDNN